MSDDNEPTSLFGENVQETDGDVVVDETVETGESERGSTVREWRKSNPSYVAWLFNSDANRLLIELAIELYQRDSDRQFNKSELAENSGTSRKSVHRHIDDLVEAGVFEEHGDARKTYSVADTEVMRNVVALNHELSKETDTSV